MPKWSDVRLLLASLVSDIIVAESIFETGVAWTVPLYMLHHYSLRHAYVALGRLKTAV